MSLNYDDFKSLKKEFKQRLHWFEEEFDMIFENKTHGHDENDIKLANQLLDRLSETINEYKDEKLLYHLVSTLSNIEKRHPEFFS